MSSWLKRLRYQRRTQFYSTNSTDPPVDATLLGRTKGEGNVIKITRLD